MSTENFKKSIFKILFPAFLGSANLLALNLFVATSNGS